MKEGEAMTYSDEQRKQAAKKVQCMRLHEGPRYEELIDSYARVAIDLQCRLTEAEELLRDIRLQRLPPAMYDRITAFFAAKEK